VAPWGAMQIVRAALVYVAVAFAAGFVLGCIRVPLLVPRLGARTAELLELPVMAVICVLVARWRQRRTATLSPRQQLAVGGIALLLLLALECALGAALQARTPVEVLAGHDPVSGAVYYVVLVLFALAPWWWARRAALTSSPGAVAAVATAPPPSAA
jgi:hypothetical protein